MPLITLMKALLAIAGRVAEGGKSVRATGIAEHGYGGLPARRAQAQAEAGRSRQ